ncbi:MAG: hypothetical protein QW692_02220 [Nitrososphaerota archaeon]
MNMERKARMARAKGAGLGVLFLTVFIAVLIGVLVAPYISQLLKPQAIQQYAPSPPPQAVYQPPAQPGLPAGFIFGQVQDVDTAEGLNGAKVDVIDPAANKLLETITADASGKFSSASVYEPGKTLILHVYATGYYDKEFTVTVPTSYTLVSNSYYYPLGVLQLKRRVDAANLNFKLQDPTGQTIASATGAAAQSAGWGSYSPSSKSTNLMLLISVTGSVSQPVAFGHPVPYITPSLAKETLKPVMWVAINSTAVSLEKLRAAGFERVENAPSNWLLVYKVLDPVETNRVNTVQTSTVMIPIDASSLASGTKVAVLVYIADLQRPADAAIGVRLTSLTAYPPYSGYGVQPMGGGYVPPSTPPANTDGWLRAVITVP